LCRRLALGAAVGLFVALPAAAQQGKVFTAADYQHAERAAAAPAAVNTLASAGRVTANWLPNDNFWYRTADGRFILVDPVKKSRGPAFDHVRVAAAMAKATGTTVDAASLPFQSIMFTKDYRSIMVSVNSKDWKCDTHGGSCTALPPCTMTSLAAIPAARAGAVGGRGGRGGGRAGRGAAAAPAPAADAGCPGAAPAQAAGGLGRGGRGGGGGRGGAGGPQSPDGHPMLMSPDGKLGAFIRDWNLWVRDTATKQERQLTHDGVENYGYATTNAGWETSDAATALWSPDSKKIATFQQDQRNVGNMYLVTTPTADPQYSVGGRQGGHPILKEWKYPLPGDSIVTMVRRVIIDVPSATVVGLKIPMDQHRSVQGDNLTMADDRWSPDASRLLFISVSREHKHVWVREADAATGAVREVFDEASPTHVENWAGEFGFHPLWASNELIWYSQRDNYGRLYLYDLATGKVKNTITTDKGNVTSVSRLDDSTHTLWFTAQGDEDGINPYFAHFYKVNLDGTHLVALTSGDGNHEAPQISPSGKYVVDVWSKTDVPYASALRDGTTGATILPLEAPADIAKLKAAGWNPIETIRMKGRDGKTDIYGQMFKPTNFDPSKKYPIINYIYPGPQTGSIGGWGFKASGGEQAGLADLGFIVVAINGMGTPGRNKDFMDAYYQHMGDNTLPDQVAGMKELAQRDSWIDINKVGIYGHSGGGFATGDAMFRYPDFFKVGIAESGNHDNREYEDDWGERYEGLSQKMPDGTTNYDADANENFAKNLKGHLMLAHGTYDENVPPYNTYLMVDALIKANKNFDLVFLPNQHHGYGAEAAYMQRRRWDYFVTWLLNGTPPVDYVMGQQGGRGGRGGE
jgi:dipeptidyl aminopeptidase/acylaminoacyl peptidase